MHIGTSRFLGVAPREQGYQEWTYAGSQKNHHDDYSEKIIHTFPSYVAEGIATETLADGSC